MPEGRLGGSSRPLKPVAMSLDGHDSSVSQHLATTAPRPPTPALCSLFLPPRTASCVLRHDEASTTDQQLSKIACSN